MVLLKIQNISYTYQNKYQTVFAVNSVSGEFESGKFYAVVGKSGSGKTTLLTLLAGLDVPSEGEVLFHGKPTTEINRDLYRRDHVAVIYQNFNLFPLLTAEENVMYPLRLRKAKKTEAREIAQSMLCEVGLSKDHFIRFPSQMSGGEQQRSAIARALAADAQIILADEPTGNLDSENGKNIVKILKKLAYEKNRCVIVVTHDYEIADQADKIIEMADGKAVKF